MTQPLHYIAVACHFWPWERCFWLGLLHDAVEDGWMSERKGARLFGPDLAVLTRTSDKTYMQYIEAIKAHGGDAQRVKEADLCVNYRRAPASFRKRYAKALAVLA